MMKIFIDIDFVLVVIVGGGLHMDAFEKEKSELYVCVYI